MAKTDSGKVALNGAAKKRPGIHSKTKAGTRKGSKNYLKRYRGQGR
jgi:hypothetical protein